MQGQPHQQNIKSNRELISLLVLGCLAMFGFGFALVPLYDVLCEKLGINGKTSNTASSYQAITVDKNRVVTVEFISQVQTGMPWKFEPQTKRLEVHPGELIHTAFLAQNVSNRAIVGQAISSISPSPLRTVTEVASRSVTMVLPRNSMSSFFNSFSP